MKQTLAVLIMIVLLSGTVVAKTRKKRNHRRQRAVPVQIIKDYGKGHFNVENELPELLCYLEDEQITPRVGQGRVHNLFGYEHLNALDVGVSPKSSKGQRLLNYLKRKLIPFIAISGRKRGVSTGPHIHIGFSSPKTYTRHPVGAVNGEFNSRHCPFYNKGGVCF